MIRISDAYKDPEGRDKRCRGVEETLPEKDQRAEEKPVKVSSDEESLEDIYNEALLLAKEKIDSAASSARVIITEDDIEFLRKLFSTASESKNGFLEEYFYENTPGNYLYAHSVNVCMLSAAVVSRMIFNEDQVLRLALASFLHDTGMAGYMDIASAGRVLQKSEKKIIEKHASEASEVIKSIPSRERNFTEDIISVASQHHERFDGSGYPDNLEKDQINRLASIISVCDVYEALTHKRPWRGAYNPARAMEMVIAERDRGFSAGVVRVLVDTLTLYPRGSIVNLDDGRSARVVEVRPESPTSPSVEIIEDMPSGEEPEIIDLSREKLLTIESIPEKISRGGDD